MEIRFATAGLIALSTLHANAIVMVDYPAMDISGLMINSPDHAGDLNTFRILGSPGEMVSILVHADGFVPEITFDGAPGFVSSMTTQDEAARGAYSGLAEGPIGTSGDHTFTVAPAGGLDLWLNGEGPLGYTLSVRVWRPKPGEASGSGLTLPAASEIVPFPIGPSVISAAPAPIPGPGGSAPIPITMGNSLVGSLMEGDTAAMQDVRGDDRYFRDAFAFNLSPNEDFQLALDSDFDAYLYLTDAAGEVLASSDTSGSTQHEQIEDRFPLGGEYHAVVTTFNAGIGGAYTISLSHSENLPALSPDVVLSPGQPIQGELTATDAAGFMGDTRSSPRFYRDAYTISGMAGQSITATLNSIFDGYIYLVGPDQQVIASNDDSGQMTQSQIVATLTQPGTHRIIVTTYAEGETGTYTLTLN